MTNTVSAVGDRSIKQMKKTYATVGLMISSALALSVAIIYGSQHGLLNGSADGMITSVELAAVTLMPYMISAAVAAIVAIAVMNVLPYGRVTDDAERIRFRLEQMADGDLSSTLRLHSGSKEMLAVAGQLNRVSNNMANNIAKLKILNRKQWGLLDNLRLAITEGDSKGTIDYLTQMEINWEEISQTEQKLIT